MSAWLTRTWRPLTMLTFVVLIVLAQLGLTPPVPDRMWPLLQLGLGGYVLGRSAEKIATAWRQNDGTAERSVG